MVTIFPGIEIGKARTHSGLEIFPLYTAAADEVDYQVAVSAIKSGEVSVEEVNDSGRVPHLLVTNTGETRVFFMEGEELTGGKQNRAVNTSVLVGSKSSIRIPVSCVEAGRWGYEGTARHLERDNLKTKLGSELNCFSPELRKSLRESVSGSLRRENGHTSSQVEIWDEIEKEQDDLGVKSSRSAMKDTFHRYEARLEEFKERLEYPGRAVGLVGIIDGQVVSFDLFDKASTCESFWGRLVSSFAVSRLKVRSKVPVGPAVPQEGADLEVADIEKFIQAASDAQWQSHQAVGEGVEYRVRTADGMEGFALHYGGTLVHGSLLAAK